MQPKVRCTDATTLKAPDSSTLFSSPFFENLECLCGRQFSRRCGLWQGFSVQHFCVGADSIFPGDAHDLAKVSEVKLIEF